MEPFPEIRFLGCTPLSRACSVERQHSMRLAIITRPPTTPEQRARAPLTNSTAARHSDSFAWRSRTQEFYVHIFSAGLGLADGIENVASRNTSEAIEAVLFLLRRYAVVDDERGVALLLDGERLSTAFLEASPALASTDGTYGVRDHFRHGEARFEERDPGKSLSYSASRSPPRTSVSACSRRTGRSRWTGTRGRLPVFTKAARARARLAVGQRG